MLPDFPLRWRWARVADPNRPPNAPKITHPLAGRRGERCRELCRGSNGARLLEFEDGFRVVAPFWSVGRA